MSLLFCPIATQHFLSIRLGSKIARRIVFSRCTCRDIFRFDALLGLSHSTCYLCGGAR